MTLLWLFGIGDAPLVSSLYHQAQTVVLRVLNAHGIVRPDADTADLKIVTAHVVARVTNATDVMRLYDSSTVSLQTAEAHTVTRTTNATTIIQKPNATTIQ